MITTVDQAVPIVFDLKTPSEKLRLLSGPGSETPKRGAVKKAAIKKKPAVKKTVAGGKRKK